MFQAEQSIPEWYMSILIPKAVSSEDIYIDADCVLHVARPVHHEYINSYNNVMLALLRSNHDIRFLVGSGTTDALYYCLKYVTKVQIEVDSVESLLMLSFERRKRKEAELELSGGHCGVSDAGRSRVNSMEITLSKRQEVSTPMCALYLRRKSALFCSHEFASVLLGQAMAIVQNETYVAIFVQREENEFVQATQYHDFVHRHEALHDMSLMEFVSKMQRVKGGKRTMVAAVTENMGAIDPSESYYFLFCEEHPLSKTHLLRKRPVPVIPDIVGPRLADRECLQTAEERERYALMALILVYPFHSDRSILQQEDSYWERLSILERAGELTEFGNGMLSSLQEYYKSKRRAAIERANLSRCGNGRNVVGEVQEDGMGEGNDDDEVDRYSEEDDHFGIEDEQDIDETDSPARLAARGVTKVFSVGVRQQIDSVPVRLCFDPCSMPIETEKLDVNVSITAVKNHFGTCGDIGMHVQEVAKKKLAKMRALVKSSRSQCPDVVEPDNSNGMHAHGDDAQVQDNNTETTSVEYLRSALGADDIAPNGGRPIRTEPRRV